MCGVQSDQRRMWPFSLKDKVCFGGRKPNLFLVVNDVFISSVSCSYSSLDIISITIHFGV